MSEEIKNTAEPKANNKILEVDNLRVYFHTKKAILKPLMETISICMKTRHSPLLENPDAENL